MTPPNELQLLARTLRDLLDDHGRNANVTAGAVTTVDENRLAFGATINGHTYTVEVSRS